MRYPLGWRLLHWLSATAILFLIPIGIWMAKRAEANLFDDFTNALYAWHKGIGFCVLILVFIRVAVKLSATAPPYPESLPKAMRITAKTMHHLMYALLLVTPLLGWAGVSAYPALGTIAGLSLPAMPGIPVDEALGLRLFNIHGICALTLTALIIGHIAAALFHALKRKDGIFSRMWFGS
jgi:cytochrome b561